MERKGVVVLSKSSNDRAEKCISVFTKVVSCVLEAKEEFCHSIKLQLLLLDSITEADYLNEDHQFLVSDVERALAERKEVAVSLGHGRGTLELSKLQCMCRFTLWDSLFPMDFSTVLDLLRDIVKELYQLGESLGAPRGVLQAIETDFSF